MAYSIPSFEQLVQIAFERHRAELPGTDALLWPNTEHPFVKTAAGLVQMNFEYLDWIRKQRFVTSSDGDQLDEHGAQFKMARKPARRAHGTIVATGASLTVIPAGTVMARSDGLELRTIAEATLFDGQAEIAGEAVETGGNGNSEGGTSLALRSPIEGVTAIAIDADGFGGGADIEGDEAYRDRLLFRMANPPRGGSLADYIVWASEVSPVRRVWTESLSYGPGTIGLWFMVDGSTANGIPGSVDVDDVREHIDGLRPGTATPIVAAPLPASIDVTITGLVPTATQME
ncbi:MAG: baseplate J/gp47 family protein, partial [Hyphomicrobiaceae bacterium]